MSFNPVSGLRAQVAGPHMPTVTDPIRVVIAVATPIVRDGLARLLTRESGFEVVGLAGTAEEALRLAGATRPDVVLLDAGFESEALGERLVAFEKAHPSLKVLLLSEGHRSPGPAEAVLLGAWGAVAPNADVEQLLKAIRTVASGEHWIGHDAVAAIVARLRRAGSATDEASGRWARLTAREREIAAAAAAGESNRDIARGLRLTEGTVKTHLVKIYKKLEISNRATLATYRTRVEH